MISQRLHRHLPDLGLHIESGGTQTSHTEGACVSGLQTPNNAAGFSVLVGTPHSTTVSSEREARQGKTVVCRLTLPPLTPRRTAPRVPAPAPGSPEQEPSLVPLITNSAVQLCSHTINIIMVVEPTPSGCTSVQAPVENCGGPFGACLPAALFPTSRNLFSQTPLPYRLPLALLPTALWVPSGLTAFGGSPFGTLKRAVVSGHSETIYSLFSPLHRLLLSLLLALLPPVRSWLLDPRRGPFGTLVVPSKHCLSDLVSGYFRTISCYCTPFTDL